jgi:hypothetical protein
MAAIRLILEAVPALSLSGGIRKRQSVLQAGVQGELRSGELPGRKLGIPSGGYKLVYYRESPSGSG